MNEIYTKLYEEEIKNYKTHLEILGYNPTTVKGKYLYLKAFLKWLEENKIFNLKEITPQNIAEYYKDLQQEKNKRNGKLLSKENINSRMRIVQQYFGYLIEIETLTKSPASALSFSSEKEPSERFIFTQSQIIELYEKAETLQEKAILNLAYGCGLRAGELEKLNREHINLQENLVIVEKGKNNKRRIIPINEKIKNELQEFSFSIEDKEQLFTNIENRRMRTQSFIRILKSLLLKTAFGKKMPMETLRKIGIHTFRHSIATHLLENGMKLEQVQYFLGYNHIETTEIYTHINENQLKNLKME